MLDRWTLAVIKPPLSHLAKGLNNSQITANQITVVGFAIGLTSLPLLALGYFGAALVAILLNRMADGLDGELARLQGATEVGAYLDIVLDFIFYSAVVVGFFLANPNDHAAPAIFLLWGFMGTGSSFLAFAILAERLGLKTMDYPNKGFYYLGGITEGTETITFLVIACLAPHYFVPLAWVFFGLCALTTISRILGGYHSLTSPS